MFFLGLVYIFKLFGIHCSEKSGNPGCISKNSLDVVLKSNVAIALF